MTRTERAEKRAGAQEKVTVHQRVTFINAVSVSTGPLQALESNERRGQKSDFLLK